MCCFWLICEVSLFFWHWGNTSYQKDVWWSWKLDMCVWVFVFVFLCECMRVCMCGAFHMGGEKLLKLCLWAASCGFYECRLFFSLFYKDELDLWLHHFSKCLLKKVEKTNFNRTKAEEQSRVRTSTRQPVGDRDLGWLPFVEIGQLNDSCRSEPAVA